MATKYIIGWTKRSRFQNKWLYAPEGAEPLLIYLREKATRFTREEANDVMLALLNAGRWEEAGAGSYPVVVEAV